MAKYFSAHIPTVQQFKDEPGVYYILNTLNACIYIGQTEHVQGRLRTHVTMLAGGTHSNQWLQRDWVDFGEHHFELGVLGYFSKNIRWARGLTRYLLDMENLYIRVYRSGNPIYGYNLNQRHGKVVMR